MAFHARISVVHSSTYLSTDTSNSWIIGSPIIEIRKKKVYKPIVCLPVTNFNCRCYLTFTSKDCENKITDQRIISVPVTEIKCRCNFILTSKDCEYKINDQRIGAKTEKTNNRNGEEKLFQTNCMPSY